MLGVTPLLGRWFRLEENEASAKPVVFLGYDLWQQRYAGNPAVVGKTVEVNGLMQRYRRHAERLAFSGAGRSPDAVAFR